MDWVSAEVDRRIQRLEAERGVKIPRNEKRRIKRGMVRGAARGAKRTEDAVVSDRDAALRHDLARELKRAGFVSEAVYLRLGALPEGYEAGARSKALFGYEEKGLSVFSGTLTVEGHYIVKLPNRWLRSSLMRFCKEEAREAYLVRGKSSGKGSDGEPLLSHVDSIRSLPADRLVASEPSSRALEKWNDLRGTRARELPVFREVLNRCSEVSRGSHLHGPDHWRRVARMGSDLAKVAGSDRTVVLLFAIFHDSVRRSELSDPGHGERGAELAERILGGRLDPDRLLKLKEACALHADGLVSEDSTIGACWDADRLDFVRVGATPDARFLSTEAGRKAAAECRDTDERGWSELLAEDDELWTILNGPSVEGG